MSHRRDHSPQARPEDYCTRCGHRCTFHGQPRAACRSIGCRCPGWATAVEAAPSRNSDDGSTDLPPSSDQEPVTVAGIGQLEVSVLAPAGYRGSVTIHLRPSAN